MNIESLHIPQAKFTLVFYYHQSSKPTGTGSNRPKKKSISLDVSELEALDAKKKKVNRRPLSSRDLVVGLKIDALDSEDQTWVCGRLLHLIYMG